MEEQKMNELDQKRIQKEQQSEKQMEANLNKKIETAKLAQLKRDRAKQSAADKQRKINAIHERKGAGKRF